jgi:TonB family protein
MNLSGGLSMSAVRVPTAVPLSGAAWTHALGWALLHFVWQGALVALLLWCALALVDVRRPRVRYALCCGALVLLAALPLATFVQLGRLDALGRRGAVAVAPWVIEVSAVNAAGEPWPARAMAALDAAAPMLPWVWLAGVAVCAGRLGIGLAGARRLRRVGVAAPEEAIVREFGEVAERVGVRRVVRLLESVWVEAPTVVGWLRPAVLLPLGCFAGLSTVQVEALLAHELAHIRRHDYLVSVLQSVVEALLFYHPAVWWVSRQVRRERECCCDEIAAAVAGDRLAYARALEQLEGQRSGMSAVILAANGGVLTMRIKRLLGYREGTVASQMGAVAVLGAVLLSVGVLAIRDAEAQPDAAPGAHAAVSSLASLPVRAVFFSSAPASMVTRGGEDARAVPVAAQTAGASAAGTLGGVVIDPTGALVSRAAVAVTNATTGERTVQETGNSGRFSFSLPGGSYLVDVTARGFERTVQQNVPVDRAETPSLTVKLPVGAVSENVMVSSAQTPAVPGGAAGGSDGAASAAREPVRVSGGVMAGNVVEQVPPVYPPDAKAKGIQGTVVLQAVVSKTGEVQHLTVVSGPEELKTSALDAVKQWRYKPYLLNGQPTEVSTTIRVNYTLGGGLPPAAPPAPGASVSAGRPLRVSGGVMAGQVVEQTPPVYPPDAKAKGVEGTVVLRARISKDGEVEDLQVVSGPEELRGSALDAVKQWKYKPFLLNGEPVEVDTTINVNYALAR